MFKIFNFYDIFKIEENRRLTYQKEVYDSLNNMKDDSVYQLLWFRKVDKYLYENLINNTITVASPSVFNDPFDCTIRKWLPQRIDELRADGACKKDLDAWKDSYSSVKVRCFSSVIDEKSNVLTVTNHLMWSHYADKHFGICLRYDLRNSDFEQNKNDLIISRFGKVRYKDECSIVNIKEMKYSDAFLLKHKCWEYENEYRLIHYDARNSADYQNISIPKSSLKEIYFGIRCKNEDIMTVLKILHHNEMNDVKVFKMEENDENLYNLKYIEVC